MVNIALFFLNGRLLTGYHFVSQKKIFCLYCWFMCWRDFKFSENCEEKVLSTGRKLMKNLENRRSLITEKHFSSFKHFNNLAFLHKFICVMLLINIIEGEVLLKQLPSVKCLVKQGTSMRGHEHNEGKLIEVSFWSPVQKMSWFSQS